MTKEALPPEPKVRLVELIKSPIETVGRALVGFIEEVGEIISLFVQAALWLIRPPYRVSVWFDACEFVGIGSLFIILLVGTFTGAVFALQSYDAFRTFHQ